MRGMDEASGSLFSCSRSAGGVRVLNTAIDENVASIALVAEQGDEHEP